MAPRDRLRAAIDHIVRDPGQLLALVLLLALITRAAWLWLPQGSLIFDEAYYVNAARTILGLPFHVGHYAGAAAGFDPNAEHPPLGKALMALSMAIFGDNGIGWRLPSVLAGMVALAAVYGVVRAAGETARLGLLAVTLFALDNLGLVHGRIGTLDMLALAPMLVGAWLGLRGHWGLAGVACAVATMVKLTGGFAVVALLLFQIIVVLMAWRRTGRIGVADLKPSILFVSVFVAVGLSGLWLLDLRFSQFPDPLTHLAHMASFGTSLQAPAGPTGIASNPWQWLVNEVQINYLRVTVDTTTAGKVVASHASIDFRGALNPILIGAAPLAFLFTGWLAWRRRSLAAIWSLTWAAANFLPYVVLVVVNQRITYLYYFLPVVPALAVAVALILVRSGLPRFVSWGYLAAMVAGFLAYYPFRELP